MTGDELDRLAAADPATVLPDAVSPPPMPGRPGRRRLPGRIAAAAGVLALGGLIAALLVAAPSDDDDPAAQPLRVSLLERPGAAALAPLPAAIDPASVRAAARAAGVEWFAARRAGRPDEACILSLGNDDRIVLHRCGPTAAGLVAGARRDGARFRVAGIVPDGIDTVTIGPRTALVRRNAFTLTTRRRPDVVILQGPSAPRIPPRADVAVAVRAGDPPAVAVPFVPDPDAIAPLGRPATLQAAAAAMPFTVLAPDPPPRGVPLVRWAAAVPPVAARVELRYLATSGSRITITERAAARGAPDRRPSVVRDTPDEAVARAVLHGTVVEVRGGGGDADDLLAVAASLRPVAP
jgi:hypothetical protein